MVKYNKRTYKQKFREDLNQIRFLLYYPMMDQLPESIMEKIDIQLYDNLKIMLFDRLYLSTEHNAYADTQNFRKKKTYEPTDF